MLSRSSSLRLVLACAAIACAGCTAGLRETYSGTYIRTWIGDDGETHQRSGPVRIEVTDGTRYSLEGASFDFPPAGTGRLEQRDGTWVLVDTGPTVGGFDRSLVVDGPFAVAAEGDALVLRQENLWGASHLLVLDRVAGD